MNLYQLAQRFVGQVVEIPGDGHSPFIQWCFTLCGYGPDTSDETPWCSAFLNAMAWLLRLPRSKSARARSWLEVGVPVLEPALAEVGNDLVVLKQAKEDPGPAETVFRGHVGCFAGWTSSGQVLVLAGNQGNAVSIKSFAAELILGIRRLA